jgi:hypothetical protein
MKGLSRKVCGPKVIQKFIELHGRNKVIPPSLLVLFNARDLILRDQEGEK